MSLHGPYNDNDGQNEEQKSALPITSLEIEHMEKGTGHLPNSSQIMAYIHDTF